MPSNIFQSSTNTAQSGSGSTDSTWARCPRSPCLVSYRPRNARRHANACRYFRCSNLYCNYLGTQKRVNDHESGCPFGLRSEEIGTTDPLSEAESEVLDILTSPDRQCSFPTDVSSTFSPESSPRKATSLTQRRALRSKPQRFPLGDQPIQGSSKSMAAPLGSGSTASTVRRREAPRRSTIDPYDPSAKKIFSLPVEAINPVLRPASARGPKNPSPVPPPPTRRLSTYEIQRYRPESQSTDTRSSIKGGCDSQGNDEPSTEMTHTASQLEAMKKCYSSLLNVFDDLAYLVSRNAADQKIRHDILNAPLDDFRRVLIQLSLHQVPDTTFLEDLNNADRSKEKENMPSVADTKEEARARTRSSSPSLSERSDFPANQTLDEFAARVRMRIVEQERRKPSESMESPGNVFKRKRRGDWPDPEPDLFEPDPPTRFMQKLADTTLDVSDEIQSSLPSRCNFKKLIADAQGKIQSKVNKRNRSK